MGKSKKFERDSSQPFIYKKTLQKLNMSQGVEEIMKRITSHRGVKQMMIINKDGLPLKTNMEVTSETERQIMHIHELATAARRLVRDVDPTDDLMFLRTRSNNQELLISPDEDFTVVVIQGNGE